MRIEKEEQKDNKQKNKKDDNNGYITTAKYCQ